MFDERDRAARRVQRGIDDGWFAGVDDGNDSNDGRLKAKITMSFTSTLSAAPANCLATRLSAGENPPAADKDRKIGLFVRSFVDRPRRAVDRQGQISSAGKPLCDGISSWRREGGPRPCGLP